MYKKKEQKITKNEILKIFSIWVKIYQFFVAIFYRNSQKKSEKVIVHWVWKTKQK